MKYFLRMLILAFVRISGLPGAFAAARQARHQPMGMQRVLLIRPDHLGDLVLTTPVLQALKDHAPDVEITLLVGPWSSEVVARHPAITQVKTCAFPGFQRSSQGLLAPYRLLFSSARQLRQQRYDLAINLRPDFWWGAALIYLARIPRRVGYAIQPGTVFLTQALAFPATEHATQSNLRLISAGLQALNRAPLTEPYTPANYPLHFIPTATEQTWVRERLQTADITASTPLVVIHAGTGGAVKLWRNAGWSWVANQLSTSSILSMPARIILTGSPQERPLLEEIAHSMTIAPIMITDASVGQLAALLKRAQLVLGVDNGPLHLATAQNTYTLRIFGPTDVRIFGPWGSHERHKVLLSTQRCPTCPAIPCGRLDFTSDELPMHPCVRLISEQQVLQAITTLLAPSIPITRI